MRLDSVKNYINRIRYRGLRFELRWWFFLARRRALVVAAPISWSRLRALANSPLVRLAVVMPFIGYVILLNAEISEHLKIRPEFNVFSNSAPWNLICVYFASFFTGVGSLTYAIACPDILKRYDNFAKYRNDERDLWRNPEFARKKSLEIRAEVVKNVHDMGIPGLLSSRNHRLFTDIEALGSDSSKVDEYLFREWELKNFSKPFARIVCAVLYAFGLMLFAIPSTKTFVKVLQFSLGVL